MADSIVDKIASLLQLAENAGSEHEANLAMQRAQQLMVKHSIDQAQIDDKLTAEQREQVVGEDILHLTKAAQLIQVNNVLWMAAAAGAGVEAVFGRNDLTLVGFEMDVRFAKSLFASLMIQREHAAIKAKHDGLRPLNVQPNRFNHSLRLAFAARCLERLAEMRKQSSYTAIKESLAPASAELMLVSRANHVQDKMTELFPKLRKGKALRYSSVDGLLAGAAAGNRADVSGGRNNISNPRLAIGG